MTDPQTTTPLSPAAQAVMDALGPSEQIELVTRCIAAAALRAAAEQVVPERGSFLSPGTAGQIRREILAITAELEPTTGTNVGD